MHQFGLQEIVASCLVLSCVDVYAMGAMRPGHCLQVRNATMDGKPTPTTYPVAFGDSFYFDIQGIDSRPTGMKVRAQPPFHRQYNRTSSHMSLALLRLWFSSRLELSRVLGIRLGR